MPRIRLREFQRLKFKDPKPYLIRLREIEREVAVSTLPEEVKELRTNSLKPHRELRQAALFCYGMGQRLGQTVYLAPSEQQDYDFVATWVSKVTRHWTRHYSPVQLKEVVPHDRNPSASIQGIVNELSKYADSAELTVAIHVNQNSHFDPRALRVPPLKIAALWAFGALSADQREWGLWGNLLVTPEGTPFQYPT
jgi:hypothetical protein